MLIRDAIEQSRSEYHVFFLVTAYIESVQHKSDVSGWPTHLLSLPLNGIPDLRRRRELAAAVIALCFQGVDSADGTIKECHEVFTTALRRLALLRDAAAASRAGSSAVRRFAGIV